MKIALFGYGRMGRVVEEIALSRGHRVVARFGSRDNSGGGGITEESLDGAEVAVDFTVPEAVPANIRAASALGVDLVVGTTGWYEALDEVRDAVERAGTGLLYAPNFSLGVSLFLRLARLAGRLADEVGEYDVHCFEAHHRHKLDHPSGTALGIAEVLLEELGSKSRWEVAPPREKADPEALQISVARAGENPGEHEVALDGPDDRIELRHQARGRSGFARGAVRAAEWIRGRKGVFTLEEMLADELGS